MIVLHYTHYDIPKQAAVTGACGQPSNLGADPFKGVSHVIEPYNPNIIIQFAVRHTICKECASLTPLLLL